MLKIAQACTSLGSSNPGTEKAPAAILAASLEAGLRYNQIKYQILEPVEAVASGQTPPEHRGLRWYHQLVDFNQRLHDQITKSMAVNSLNDQFLTLGGDHSVGIGSMLAAKTLRPAARVVYIDAHPDCHEHPEDTTSGNLHGLPVSTVLGDGIAAEFADSPTYDYRDFAFIGLKDIDADEAQYLERHQLLRVTMDDIIEHGLGQGMTRILDFAEAKPLHVVLDIDSIDASEAPATGIINRGGFDYREISYICRRLNQQQITSIDLVEVNPDRPGAEQTMALAAELVIALLGGDWSPYTRYLADHPAPSTS